MPSGYSGSSLSKKLGLKPNHKAQFIGLSGAILDELELDSLELVSEGKADVIVACFTECTAMRKELPQLGDRVFPNGRLWIAWPKKASKIATNITEQSIRDHCLPMGLVDNKVCAIDEVWSGLQLVWRVELRK